MQMKGEKIAKDMLNKVAIYVKNVGKEIAENIMS